MPATHPLTTDPNLRTVAYGLAPGAVSEQIDVYLVDFGFARIGDGEVGVSSVVKGTLGFMPPEQLFNRQLTEASDLYGFGMTLICLLTGTKSNQIGDLVDISYQIKFKHLVSKLNFHWVNWLEKMVEPKIKNRYPNAIAASAAMPAHPMRLPEAKLSQSSLHFKATRLNERLTQMVCLSNLVPETQLAGEWQVALILTTRLIPPILMPGSLFSRKNLSATMLSAKSQSILTDSCLKKYMSEMFYCKPMLYRLLTR